MANHQLIFTFGILGNIISIMMFLAPLPTFLRVYRKKSTEGFQSIPYMVALLSSMLWIYYATLKSNNILLIITINAIGCLIESFYILAFVVYAPKKARMLTLKLLLLLNLVGFFSIFVFTYFFAKESTRLHIVGFFCVASSAALFASPLSIMRVVIRTKSVEFMPFTLSFFLTLNAVMWLVYGILLRDFYIAVPNIVGVALGALQLILYAIYKGRREEMTVEQKLPEQINSNVVKLSPIKPMEMHEVSPLPICVDIEVGVKEENADNGQRKHNQDHNI